MEPLLFKPKRILVKMDDEPKDIQEVKLKNGKKMWHFKENDGRHIFFANPVMMNVWVMGMLVFILITSLFIGAYQLSLTTEIGNRMLSELAACRATSSGEFFVVRNDTLLTQVTSGEDE